MVAAGCWLPWSVTPRPRTLRNDKRGLRVQLVHQIHSTPHMVVRPVKKWDSQDTPTTALWWVLEGVDDVYCIARTSIIALRSTNGLSSSNGAWAV